MPKNKKKAQNPISLAVYRQFVYDCAVELMSADCDKEQIINRLIDLADCPIQEAGKNTAAVPVVKVIVEEGCCRNVLSDSPVDVEFVGIDKDYSDYAELQEYWDKLEKDPRLTSCDFTTANFE